MAAMKQVHITIDVNRMNVNNIFFKICLRLKMSYFD